MKRFLITSLSLLILIPALRAQNVLTLDNCRKMALENNKRLMISQEKINAAEQTRKSAGTEYFPKFSATGTYMYNSRNISLLENDAFLPVGTKMADGSFGFSLDPDMYPTTGRLSPELNNTWALENGQYVPLDANGKPFNPKTNPEKLDWKNYAYIPKEFFEFDVHNVFAGTVTVLQPVYMGGKIRAYHQITKYAEQLARTQHNTLQQDVIINTDEVYWQIVSLVSKKELAESYLKLLETLKYNVEAMIAEGVATRADGLSVQVKLNEAQIALLKVNDGLTLSKMLLCQICGLPLDTQFSLADENLDAYTRESLPTDIDIMQAVNRRDEIKSLELAGDIYKRKERVIRSEGLPNIALAGNYIVSNPNVYNGFKTSFNGMWNAGVVVNIPIFHWGNISHKIKAAKAETRITQLEMEEAKEKIELQINQSIFRVKEAYKTTEMANHNLDKADENLMYANAGYEEGVMPLTNVFEAQAAWLSAKAGQIDARIDATMADTYLKKATGTLLPETDEVNNKYKK